MEKEKLEEARRMLENDEACCRKIRRGIKENS